MARRGWPGANASAREADGRPATRAAAAQEALKRADTFGAVLLAAACVHEFSWQLLPWEYQGPWRAVTQWPVIAWACFCAVRPERSRLLAAAGLATAMMSSTTAICSAAWLAHPWQLNPGQSQCSQWLGWPVLLLSALIALLALLRWRDES